MVFDEPARRYLHQRLDEVLGPEAASTLLAHLPPEGWESLVTRRELEQLEERVELRFDRTHDRFAQVDDALSALELRFNHRFALVDARLASVERRADDRESGLSARLDVHEEVVRSALLDWQASFERALSRQTTVVLAGVAVVVAMAALAVALAGLGS